MSTPRNVCFNTEAGVRGLFKDTYRPHTTFRVGYVLRALHGEQWRGMGEIWAKKSESKYQWERKGRNEVWLLPLASYSGGQGTDAQCDWNPADISPSPSPHVPGPHSFEPLLMWRSNVHPARHLGPFYGSLWATTWAWKKPVLGERQENAVANTCPE